MHQGESSMSSNKKSVVALVGAPNSGKTTLYNWLTGSKFKTVNYPGATVEYSIGDLASRYGDSFLVMDTPGTYSLFPKSADEEVTYKALYDHPDFQVDKVILVVDGTQMARHLLLAKQLKEAKFNLVIAVTMSDLLSKNKIQLNTNLLSEYFKCPVVITDGILGGGVIDLVKSVRSLPLPSANSLAASVAITPTKKTSVVRFQQKIAHWQDDKINQVQTEMDRLTEKVLGQPDKIDAIFRNTFWWDQILLHPILGVLSFLIIMGALFSSIFWVAAPFMDIVDGAFGALVKFVSELGPGTLWADFAANGIVASFGAAMVFVPQIFILFLGIGILEGSGYLARAATVIDKPFSLIGLSGRSFVPFLSGYACAIPALMATRNISSKRDRWITNFIIPLMQCSARLPVFALLLSFLYKDAPAWKPGFALALIYISSIFIGALAAAILNKILAKHKATFFMMELPLYRRPQIKVLLKQTWDRTMAYVRRAGPAIFAFAVIVWMGTTFPNYKAEGPEKLQSSYMGQVGHMIEPVFKPMGVDWRVGVGLMSAFAAREVFVSSMAIMFNVTSDGEEQTNGLLKAMEEAKFSDGTPIFTLGSVLGLIVFFMIALQCMSTVAMSAKENGSWKFPILQLVTFNLVAYVLAVTIVKIFQ
jgi:ferrous iron transport protein B